MEDEYNALSDSLADAESRGWCEVIGLPYATPDQIFGIFQKKCRNRVAIFHYAGHADKYHLLFETAEGEPLMAKSGGLASFLSRQEGLKLVFLNGCNTFGHAQGSPDAGVPAVIVTSRPVNDEEAWKFAERFYMGLVGGAALRTAFEEAGDAMVTLGYDDPTHVWLCR